MQCKQKSEIQERWLTKGILRYITRPVYKTAANSQRPSTGFRIQLSYSRYCACKHTGNSQWRLSNWKYSRRHLYAYRLAAYFALLHKFLSVPIFNTVFNGYQFRSIAYRIYAYFALVQEFFWSEHALLCVNFLRLTAFDQICFFRNKNNTNTKIRAVNINMAAIKSSLVSRWRYGR